MFFYVANYNKTQFRKEIIIKFTTKLKAARITI